MKKVLSTAMALILVISMLPACLLKITAADTGCSDAVMVLITFNANGGEVYPETKTVTFGGTYGELPEPQMEGFIFEGWYTQSGIFINANTTVAITAPQILYAKWGDPNESYVLSFNNNGGSSGLVIGRKLFYGAKVTFIDNWPSYEPIYCDPPGYVPMVMQQLPEKSGYILLGWAETPNAVSPITTFIMPAHDVKLYAVWAKAVTITFNPSNGTNPVTSTMLPGKPLSAPKLTYTGYKLLAWSPALPTTVPDEDTTYSAIWAPGILINLDAQGGSVTPAAISVLTGTAYGDLPVPTKDGFDFLGWYTAPNGEGTKVCSTTTVTVTAGQTLYAKWFGYSYIVEFDAQGGSVSPKTNGVINGETYGSLPVPTKAGYNFGGWYTSPYGEGTKIFSTTQVFLTERQTLYAKWIGAAFTVFYDGNGSTSGEMASSSFHYCVPQSLANNLFEKVGFRFLGWSSDPSASTASYTDGDSLLMLEPVASNSLTLYAVWSDHQVSIKFDAGGGSGGSIFSMIPGEPLEAPTVSKPGYTISGWSPALPEVVPDTNTTYQAQWVPASYTIYFYAGLGTVDQSTKAVTYGSKYGKLPIPTRQGYTFCGWWTKEGLPYYDPSIPYDLYDWGSLVIETSTVRITSDQSLYAKWKMTEYELKFDSNGGTGGFTPSQSLPEGTKATIFINSNGNYSFSFDYPYGYEPPLDLLMPYSYPQKPGYKFLGWAASPDASAPVTDLIMPAHTVTLYAVWQKTVTITFCAWNESDTIKYEMIPGEPLSAPEFTFPGFTLAGWYPSMPETVPNENTTYIADWAANCYSVNFITNGGSAVSSITQDYETRVNKPADPVRTGYTFAGWFKNSELTGAISWPYTVEAKNVTFYAKWNKIPLKLGISTGSSAVINENKHLIFGLAAGINESDLKSKVSCVNGNGRLAITGNTNGFGTGTKVELIDNETNAAAETFYVVISGDVDGDGYITSADYDKVKMAASYQTAFNESSADQSAADLNQDGVIDAFDLNIIRAALLGIGTVNPVTSDER